MGVGGWRLAPSLYPQERAGGHCTGGWVGPRAGLHGCGKSRPPPGFDPRTVQPVAIRCTDWATLANKRGHTSLFNKFISPFTRTCAWKTTHRRLRQYYQSRRRKIPEERKPVVFVLRTRLRASKLHSGGERWMNMGALVEYITGRKTAPFPLRTQKKKFHIDRLGIESWPPCREAGN